MSNEPPPRDDKQRRVARQCHNEVVGDPVDEVLLLGVGAQIGKGQNRDRGFVGQGQIWFSRRDLLDRLRDADLGLRPSKGENPDGGTVGRLLVLPHCSKKPHAFARKGLDQTLVGPAVANCGPDGVDSRA
jgi:hypothetical protein